MCLDSYISSLTPEQVKRELIKMGIVPPSTPKK